MQLTIHGITRRAAVPAAAVVIATVALAGCSSSSSSSEPAADSTPTTSAAAHTTPPAPATCPLTGAVPKKGQDRKRVALAVKIDNVVGALPQTGVNNADVVVEELVEGGLTRLMAIFQCDSAAKVGPIRSLRISDADILALLHGSVFSYSGANPKDVPPVAKNSKAVLLSQDANPEYYYRSGPNAAPHNVYSSTAKVLGAGVKRKKSLTAPPALFSFGAIDASAKKATSVALNWSTSTSASWLYSKGEYLRTQNGSADKLSDGSQITATNIAILNVKIASTGLHDVLGNPSPLDVTTGHGNLWVLRNGKVIKGVWHRAKVTDEFTFRDKSGNKILLSPGRTWVELLPDGRKPLLH